jgi:hypothetical protein
MKKLIAILLCVGLIGVGSNLFFSNKDSYDVVTAASPRIPTVSLVSKTTTTITVSWGAITDATGYNVYLNSEKNNSLLLTSLTYTITGLSANTTYSIEVSATRGSDEKKSALLSVTTNSVPSSVATSTPSQAVSSLVASSQAVSSSATISSSKAVSSAQNVTSSASMSMTSNTSSNNAEVQAVISNESVVSSQTVNSNESKIDFLLPVGIVLILILSIIILLVLNQKKRTKL